MIKSLRDARMTDCLPKIVAEQKWVQALSETVGVLFEKAIDFVDRSQIYTDVDNVKEEILDVLAANWKVDWYDPTYSVEQKRRIIKSALVVRRLMGTVHALEAQVDAVYPGSEIEEWFDYSGDPGFFRLCVNITHSDSEHPVNVMSEADIERKLVTAKRFSAHLENVSYMILHAVQLDLSIASFKSILPECGTIRCGTYSGTKRIGRSEEIGLLMGAEDSSIEVYASTNAQCGLKHCGQ